VLVERPSWVGQGGGEFVKLNRALLNARAILREAVRYFDPVRVYACFSGGYDSAAAVVMTLSTLWWGKTARSLHECGGLPKPVDLRVLHINTGIGIEATRQYVRDFCNHRDIPYLEVKTPESYEQLVLERGFPGPAMHAKMYQRLKERAIRIAVREAKMGAPRSRNVLLVSGIRHDESMIRAGYQRCVSRVDAQVWINPLYWATVDEFRLIREIYAVPANPVKDRLGMSGECLCGAYADKGELLRVRLVCPQTADYIEELERKVWAAGHRWRWEDPGPPRDRRAKGDRAAIYQPDEDDFRPMCASCEKTKWVEVGEAQACGAGPPDHHGEEGK
jgi:3'-phosphoadenosine 5'-phosphosulfate sulfotransferase (PAPS reductase)/FAD synthetase